jgi:hypothetical protein
LKGDRGMRRFSAVFLIPLVVLGVGCSTGPATWRCTTTGGEPGDSSDVVAACEHARQVFTRLLNRTAPAVQVELGESSGAGRYFVRLMRAHMRLPTFDAYSAGRKSSDDLEARRAEWQDFVAHEVMHILMRSLPGARGREVGYGTAYPDWFDEALAIAAESRELRMRRLRQARAAVEDLPDLDSLLDARHPSQTNKWPRGIERVTVSITLCGRPCARPGHRSDTITVVQRRVEGRTVVDTLYGPTQYANAGNNVFYISSYALLEFVRLRAGDDALDALVNTYRAEERKPLPAFFSDLPSASTEWKEWLRSNKPPRPLL